MGHLSLPPRLRRERFVATAVATTLICGSGVCRRNREKPDEHGLFACADEDANLHEPYSSQGPQPWSRSRDASDMALAPQMLRRPRTVRTDLTRRLLPRVLSRGGLEAADHRASGERVLDASPIEELA